MSYRSKGQKYRWQGFCKGKRWYLFKFRFTDLDNRTITTNAIIRDVFGRKHILEVTLNDEKGIIDSKIIKTVSPSKIFWKEKRRQQLFLRPTSWWIRELLKQNLSIKEIAQIIEEKIAEGRCKRPKSFKTVEQYIDYFIKRQSRELKRSLNLDQVTSLGQS